MSRLLIDCRSIDDGPAGKALGELVAELRREAGGADLHFLVDAERLAENPDLIGRLRLDAYPPASVHRLHAPPPGRQGSSFAAWRDRTREAIAVSIAVELDARRVVVPCEEVDAARAPWPAGRETPGIEVVAAIWRGGWGERQTLWAEPRRQAATAGQLPLLAFVSPLPPDHSGIADYAMELIPELAKCYRLELVTTNPAGVTPALADFPVRSVEWFDSNAGLYDRIVYQFGNSDFHQHMFGLNERHPGLVVLHDAFLSGVARHMEKTGYRQGHYSERLYLDHGYRAVAERSRRHGALNTVMRYPCSLGAIGPALGVVVHSQEARCIVATHYGETLASGLDVIPHLRAVTGQPHRAEARRELGLTDREFLVCSFGATSETKLNARLLSAWLQSSLGRDPDCRLVFVGGNSDRYTQRLVRAAAGANASVTGRCPAGQYRSYLQAADMAVQLRAFSRGETSGAALDCLAAGLPLVVNRHGSMAELPEAAVAMIDDEFADRALAAELERLRGDPAERERLRTAALDHVRTVHDPLEAGRHYRDAIEAAHAQLRAGASWPRRLAAALPPAVVPAMAETAAACAELSLPRPREKARIFFDVTAIARNDLGSGVERTVRNLLLAMLENQPDGYRVEPVRLERGQLILARDYTCRLLGIRRFPFGDEPVAVRPGDIYMTVDLAHRDVVAHRDLYRAMRRQGVKTAFMVHDLLPVRQPHYFPARAQADHTAWLDVVAEADIIVGVTRHVAGDLADWYAERAVPRMPAIGFSHHGAELSADAASGIPTMWEKFRLRAIGQRPTFLTVGTVEPRKGHDDLLAAFETLWAAGRQADLVVVGRAGFRPLDVMRRMRRHPQKGRHLFWFRNASDAMLDQLYRRSQCLVAPSRAEGFGLPLIEAGLNGLPVLARDIAVFREVAPRGTRFFADAGPDALAAALAEWLDDAPSRRPTGDVLTWARSADNLVRLVTGQPVAGGADPHGHCGMVRP